MDQIKTFRLVDEFSQGSKKDYIDLTITIQLREGYFNIELHFEYSECVREYPRPELSRISPLSAYDGIFLNTTFFKVFQNDLVNKMIAELMLDDNKFVKIPNMTPQFYREKILLSLIIISNN